MNIYQSPQWGAIADKDLLSTSARVSIPEMGGNSLLYQSGAIMSSINPRNGGAIAGAATTQGLKHVSIPAMGGNRTVSHHRHKSVRINPRNGGQ